MTRRVSLLAVSLVLSSCSVLDPHADAKEAISRDLKDPSSAEFRDLRLCEDGTSTEGEVNSKNSYGAYVGFKKFVVAGFEKAIDGEDMASARDYHNLVRKCHPSYKLTDFDDIEPDNFDAIAE